MIRLDKKQKYFLLSLLMTICLYLFIRTIPEINYYLVGLMVLILFGGSYVVHLPNSNPFNIVVTSTLLLALLTGFLLSTIYFPSLSIIFRLAALFVFMVMFYIILLVNNVFLVVASREEPIPLYRVALTWSKILMATVSIPLMAGIFKISINSFGEAALVNLAALLFYFFLIWSLKFNPDVKKYKVGELIALVLLGSFMVLTATMSVSFIPTETFLRSLYVSSILIFGISYIEAHLRNSITKKLISEHVAISLVFLILLFIFKP